MKRLLQDWNHFWFEERSTLPLGVFRCVFGLLLLADLLTLCPDITMFFSDEGYLRARTAWMLEGWDRFSLLYFVESPPVVRAFFGVYAVALVLFIVGLGTRVVKFLVYLMLISVHHRNHFILSGMDTYTQAMCFLVLWTPCGQSFSLDAVLRHVCRKFKGLPDEPSPKAPVWGRRLLQLQLCAVYFFALSMKAHGELWRDGTVVYYLQHLLEFRQFPLPGMTSSLVLVNLATYFTLFVQLSLATLVWNPYLRPYVLSIGAIEHLVMAWNLNIPLFQFFLMSGFVLFLDEGFFERCISRIRSAWPARRAVVVYDGDCGFCQGTVVGLGALDFLGRLEFINVHDRKRFSLLHGRVDERECLEEMHLLDPAERVHKGFYAFRWIVWRIPLLWPVAPLLSLPGVPWVGRGIYRWVASHRFFLRPSGPTVCPLHG